MNAHWKRLAVASVAIVSVLAGACAAPPPQIPATTQPALSTIAQPYAQGLRRAGVQSVQVFSNGARVRVATNFGELYLRYPAGLSPTAFAVYVDGTAVEVDSDTYNAGNSATYGDSTLPARVYTGGQALFDARNPVKLIARSASPFLRPTESYERTGQYSAGTTFVEGLVPFKGAWYLYYGTADSRVGVAVWRPRP